MRSEKDGLRETVPRPLRENRKCDDNAHTLPVPGALDQTQPSNIESDFAVKRNGSFDLLEFIFHKTVTSVRVSCANKFGKILLIAICMVICQYLQCMFFPSNEIE